MMRSKLESSQKNWLNSETINKFLLLHDNELWNKMYMYDRFRQCVKLATTNNRNETKIYEINIKKDCQAVPH